MDVKLSCMALTEPLEAAVVAVAHSEEAPIPEPHFLALHISDALYPFGAGPRR